MEIVDNTVVKFTVPKHIVPYITEHIEKSEVLEWRGDIAEMAVYWGLEEISTLNQIVSFRENIPSPMVRDYKWPGLYTPFKHQTTTAEFLSTRRRAFCFNEAGTGKTSSVIWAADYLMTHSDVKRVLIICPLSIRSEEHTSELQSH